MKKPVLLKRGLANTIEEWIMAAEIHYGRGVMKNVIFCERGIRTFEKIYPQHPRPFCGAYQSSKKTHLPVIIDPSHATGNWQYVRKCMLSLAAIAAGADGLIIEVHPDPEHAWSDGAQSLKPDRFRTVIEKGRAIAQVNRQRYLDETSRRPVLAGGGLLYPEGSISCR